MKKRKLILPIVALLMGVSANSTYGLSLKSNAILNLGTPVQGKENTYYETFGTGSFSNNIITWSMANNNITLTQNKGNSQNNPSNSYTSDARVYKGQYLHFHAEGDYTITKIEIKYNSSYYGNSMTAGVAISNNTITDSTGQNGVLNATWGSSSNGTHVIETKDEDGLEDIYIQNVASTNVQLRWNSGGVKVTYKYSTSGQETKHTVTFSNGTENIGVAKVEDGNTIPSSSIPTNRGFSPTLYSNYDNGVFSDTFDYVNEIITGDITIYIKWVKVDATTTYSTSLADGDYRIRGEVIATYNGNKTQFIIQDGENSMYVEGSTGVAVGNTVDIFGTYSNSTNKITNLAYCDIDDKNDRTIDQTPLTNLSDVIESNAYKYISLTNVKLESDFTSESGTKQFTFGTDKVAKYNALACVSGLTSGFAYNKGYYVDFTGAILTTGEILLTSFALSAQHTVTFKIGGTTYYSEIVLDGYTVNLPENPTKDDDESYKYTFNGWLKEDDSTFDPSTAITQDLILHADFISIPLSAEEKVAKTSTKVKLNYNYNQAAISGSENIDFSSNNYSNGEEITSVQCTHFSIEFDQGTNSNVPKYYTSGTAIRAYGGNTFTISSTHTITSIGITFGSSDGSNAITADVGTYEDGTWTGSAYSVTFTVGGTSGNRRLASINVGYEGTKLNFSDVNLNFGAIVTKENYNSIFDGVSTKKIGVAFARTSKLTADEKTIEQALIDPNATYIGKTEVDPAVTTPFPTDENGVLDVNGTHYSWSVTLAVPTLDAESKYTEAFLTESITAVAYMYVEDHYVFFGERAMSVAQAAEAYKTHPVYTGGTAMTRATLDYLAALDD